MGYILSSYIEDGLTTDTVVRRPIASSQQGQTMAKSHNILLRRKRGTSGWNFDTIFFPFLISAISISHNIFLIFLDITFLGILLVPPYPQIVIPEKSAATLSKVRAKAVERSKKSRHMEDVAHKDELAV